MTPVNIGLRSNPLLMISCVRALVWVTQHGTWRGWLSGVPRKLNTGTGSRSPGWASSLLKSMDRPSIRGGVPVFNRPCGSFNSFSLADKFIAGGSPARPAL